MALQHHILQPKHTACHSLLHSDAVYHYLVHLTAKRNKKKTFFSLLLYTEKRRNNHGWDIYFIMTYHCGWRGGTRATTHTYSTHTVRATAHSVMVFLGGAIGWIVVGFMMVMFTCPNVQCTIVHCSIGPVVFHI